MSARFYIILFLVLSTLFIFSCSKKSSSHTDLPVSQALTEYWEGSTDLTTALETRDGTMSQITTHINSLGAKSNRDAISDIDALVGTYVSQSENCADYFDQLVTLEEAIKPYGDQDKNIFGDIARGVYNKAKDTVVSSGRMVRSGWRVLSGSKSLRQVLNDPESGIPIVSNFAEKIQKHNADRDAAIRTQILNNNSQDGAIPLEQLPGTTPQEKLNSYLNLPDEDPLKMNIRRDVMTWDEAERTRTAQTAKELGETGVKTVGDAYGGGVGEWTNEVVLENMSHGQNENDKGTLHITVNNDATGNAPITTGKTIIISKKDQPDTDPRITVIMNAPQDLQQQLPSGSYDFIVLADGFIRSTIESLTIAQNQLQDVMAKLLNLQGNAIVVQSLIADPETVTKSTTAHVSLSCVSTIGQSLDFSWAVTGGTYSNVSSQQTDFSFKPTQEGTYTVTVTITDGQNNSKTASVDIQVIAAQLELDHYTIANESFSDTKINPGELVTMSLYIKNMGTTDLTGIETAEGVDGITIGYTPYNALIPAGETGIWDINVQIPENYSQTTGVVLYKFSTHDANNNPVTITIPIDFPVEFSVVIDEITSPVTDRVLNVTGRIANPLLTEAYLILDNDYEHQSTVNVSNGYFYRQIAIGGSTHEVNHSVKVIAQSGSITAEDTETFTSNVPVTQLRMTLSWDTGGTDVDFWCTDPNGEKCYYAHSYTASGLELDFDDTDGYGPENITTETIIPGDYIVQVHFYSTHTTGAVPTSCQVVIRQNEGQNNAQTTNYYGNIANTGDIWTVTTLHYDGEKFTVKPNNTYGKYPSKNLPLKK